MTYETLTTHQAELRMLATEMHVWAPDRHALWIRDRLLALSRNAVANAPEEATGSPGSTDLAAALRRSRCIYGIEDREWRHPMSSEIETILAVVKAFGVADATSPQEGDRPILVNGERDAGPWEHDDGSSCEVFLSSRPSPSGLDSAWWCTEHQQHVHPAAPPTEGEAGNDGAPRVDIDTAEAIATLHHIEQHLAALVGVQFPKARSGVPPQKLEHLTLSDGTELRHRTVKSLQEGTRDDSARWSPSLDQP